MKFSRVINILIVASVLFAAAGFSSAPVAAQEVTPEIDRDTLYVPGELIVTYGRGVSPNTAYASALDVAKTFKGEVVRSAGNFNLLSFDESADVISLRRQIAGQPGVKNVQLNYIRWIPESGPGGSAHTLTSVEFRSADGRTREISMDQLKKMRTLRKVNGKIKSVPSYPVESYDQWGWWSVNASMIWPEKAVSAGVCVIDTGVDAKHPDLAGKLLTGIDFVNDDTKPDDDNGHGTHVSGTIAAVMNNVKGFSGISNGKVVPVKVLSAQGWGTTFNIAQGIAYCASRADIKVINMSLGGGTASQLEYDALKYAVTPTNQIVTGGDFAGLLGRGKLVVVAAGNESTSDFSFPAAWAADFVCDDGTDTFPTACGTNTIHQGMLAVGAARSWYWDDDLNDSDLNDDGYLWVDTDGDGLEPGELDVDFDDEHFNLSDCATDFSNYGAWVDIVAPGEDILSSVPVSYPYYGEFYYDEDWDNDGYEWYSGTSMAAPHVAAGAARAWSVFPAYTNSMMKNQLLNTGDVFSVDIAMDPNITDPNLGYYGVDGDGINGYLGEAPYCWPDATFGDIYDMTDAVYLNVAGAMNRGALWAEVYDSVTGLPLKGATVKAYLGTVLKDQTVLAYDTEYYADLLNLPGGEDIDIKINKTGYTSGDQWVGWNSVTPGYWDWGPWLTVGVPPNDKRIHAVLNWDSGADLDFFTWTAGGWVVGPWDPGAGQYYDEGDLNEFPFARWNRDGGYDVYDGLGLESITIAPKPGSTTIPFYNVTPADYYDFLVTNSDLADAPDALNDYMIMRVWAGGKIVGTAEKNAVCDTDGPNDIPEDGDDETWWLAGWMNGSVFFEGDDCGTGEVYDDTTAPNGAWPYRVNVRDSNSGIPERPDGSK